MKHIKLFEQVASVLPKVFSTEEIKNMTQDEFFEVMEMYYREPNKLPISLKNFFDKLKEHGKR